MSVNAKHSSEIPDEPKRCHLLMRPDGSCEICDATLERQIREQAAEIESLKRRLVECTEFVDQYRAIADEATKHESEYEELCIGVTTIHREFERVLDSVARLGPPAVLEKLRRELMLLIYRQADQEMLIARLKAKRAPSTKKLAKRDRMIAQLARKYQETHQ